MKREKIDKRRENLWLPATVDWSYCANRSRSDPASWLEEPYRCVVIGCLLIDLVMLIDSYRSMIMRFASPATRGFLSPLLSLYCLVSSRRKKTSGTRVVSIKRLVWNMNKLVLLTRSLPLMKGRKRELYWTNLGLSILTAGNLKLFRTAANYSN